MPVAPIAQFKKAAASRTHLLLMPVATSKIAEGGRFAAEKPKKVQNVFIWFPYNQVNFFDFLKSTQPEGG